MEWIVWGILPYVVMTLFIGGHIFRYKYDQFGWTTKSSEFLEKKDLKLGSNLFHWGIIFVFGGHVMGIIVPKGLHESLGLSETAYHTLALVAGIPAGVIALIGLIILIRRRFKHQRIRLTTSKADWVALFGLLLVVGSGLAATFLNIDSQGFDYRETIGPWFRGLFKLNIQPELMSSVPLWFKVHVLGGFILFAVWPFTRLVHFFSLPLLYISRSPIIYRRHSKKAS